MAAPSSNDRIRTSAPPPGVVPLCPHCGEPLGGLYKQTLGESFGKAYVWFCSGCHKTLGVSHRKGFWMG